MPKGVYQHKSPSIMTRQKMREAHVTHGLRSTPAYTSWAAMIQRCTNPNNTGYKNYGGRGISICERWLTFEGFFADMGQKPSSELSLDRLDPDGNYEPGNCRWATPKEQTMNKRAFCSQCGQQLTCSIC
jgi:hypothetical protein